ncbi:hypothetical protein DPMN_068945 [Dreissena polymorpha]|uniref:Uncharacterized protein n=1 Tax=Dreissena polymorpha TaxID=45954 RepID=A0A9D3Z367_DREPO|nr:hypothetical protein DPMN_068945 [Dreissena polymorpha]
MDFMVKTAASRVAQIAVHAVMQTAALRVEEDIMGLLVRFPALVQCVRMVNATDKMEFVPRVSPVTLGILAMKHARPDV